MAIRQRFSKGCCRRKSQPHLRQEAPASSLPPGSMSVVAANNGLPVPYVPMPIVTIPPTTQSQGPPPPHIPQPRQTAMYVNAFTPPAPPKSTGGDNFTPEQLMHPAVLSGIYATNPYLSNPMLMQRDRQMYDQLPAPQQALMQQAYYIQQQQMLMQPQRPILPVGYPANYQGPQPPNPFAGSYPQGNAGVTQAYYQQPTYSPYWQYGPANNGAMQAYYQQPAYPQYSQYPQYPQYPSAYSPYYGWSYR